MVPPVDIASSSGWAWKKTKVAMPASSHPATGYDTDRL
jgi:hypothetical protein